MSNILLRHEREFGLLRDAGYLIFGAVFAYAFIHHPSVLVKAGTVFFATLFLGKFLRQAWAYIVKDADLPRSPNWRLCIEAGTLLLALQVPFLSGALVFWLYFGLVTVSVSALAILSGRKLNGQ